MRVAGLAGLAAGAAGCSSSCATYLVTIVVQDDTSQALVCDAKVTFGVGDAGAPVDASFPLSDAEVPASSTDCQWSLTVGGGTYQVTATAPGFLAGSATLDLSKDRCGTTSAPVTVVLVRAT